MVVAGDADVKEFKCPTCGKAFRIERNLQLHLKLHLGQKDYFCDVCDRAFFTKTGLVAHQTQMHSPSTPPTAEAGSSFFSCDVCQMQLPTRHDLVSSQQCDQIWRNFAIFTKKVKSWAIFKSLI